MCLVSLLGLSGDDSPLLDFHLLDVFSESALDGCDNVGLVGLEGVEVPAPSDLELGHAGVLLDEDGCIGGGVLFLLGFLALSAGLPSFSRFRNSLAFLIYFGWIGKGVPLWLWC
jgi:hypothetical protein